MDTCFERLPGEGTMVEVPYQPVQRGGASPTAEPSSPSAADPSSNNGPARAGIVLLAPTDGHPVPVSLTITNYRIHAQPAPRLPVRVQPVNVPLLAIESHSRGSVHVSGGKQWTLTVQTKLVFSFTFGFREEAAFQRIVKCLDFVVQEATSHLRQLPAFTIAAAFRKESGLPTAAAEIEAARERKALEGKIQLSVPSAVAPAASSSDDDDDEKKQQPTSPKKEGGDDESPARGNTGNGQQAGSESPDNKNTSSAATVDPAFAEWAADAGWTLYDVEEEWARQLALDPTAPVATDVEAAGSAVGVGKDLRPWYRVTYLDQPTTSYGTFATYPVGIVAPNSCSDDLLKRAAVFRSRARIPAISYVCLASGGVIARCSQPMLRQSDSARRDDSALCASLINAYNAITTKPRDVPHAASLAASATAAKPASGSVPTGSSFVAPPSLVDDGDWDLPTTKDAAPTPAAAIVPRTLNVIDLRPKGAATGNMAMGGGYESGSGYGMCKVQFSGIENIHAVTAAWQKLRAIVREHNGRGNGTHGRSSGDSFHEQLHASMWLYHIQKVLIAADEITQLVSAQREPVLTHCTDGWDRTSQATSLAMILMDPYFRTVRGLCVLIEKEFCSFGHKFAERNMHELPGDTCGTAHISGGLSDVDRQQDHQPHKPHKQQPSPIFSQWLDCVFQVVRQFPTKFEFTPRLLELLAYHVHSCFFGTFICNGARERILEGVTTGTISLWSEIERLVRVERENGAPSSSATRLLNPLYRPPQPPRRDASQAPSPSASTTDVTSGATAAPKTAPGVQLDRLPLCVDSVRLAFWESHYLKYDADRWHGCPSFEEAALAALPPVTEDPTASMWQNAAARRPGVRGKHIHAVAFRDPAIKRREVSSKQAAAQSVPADPKAKQCWNCHEKFVAFLRPSAPCGHCRHLHCPKCLLSIPGSKEKRCESCSSAFAGSHDQPDDE